MSSSQLTASRLLTLTEPPKNSMASSAPSAMYMLLICVPLPTALSVSPLCSMSAEERAPEYRMRTYVSLPELSALSSPPYIILLSTSVAASFTPSPAPDMRALPFRIMPPQ